MQEISENHVQRAEKNIKRRRSREEKIGRLKYNQQLLNRVLDKIEEVKGMQRIILNGLKGAGYFHFDRPMIERLACLDQVDLEICEILHEAGPDGVFPKNVAKQLGQGLEYYDVSRRTVRMNKRLDHQTGERLFEKRGHRWALTRFAFEVWGETEEDEEIRERALTGPKAEGRERCRSM